MPSVAIRRGRTPAATIVQVTDLTGGLDRRVSPTLMKPDRARRLRNADLSVAGEWRPRSGWADWSTASLGAGRGQGAGRIYLNGVTPFSLFAYDGDVYKQTDGGVAGSAVLTGLDASADIFFPYDSEIVAVLDATNVPKKSIDGTTWTQLGITAPSGAPTLAAVAGGSLIDAHTYEVSYTYAASGSTHPAAESNEGATATQAVAGANLTVRVTIATSSDPQVDTINVYVRDVTAGESVRRYAGTRANTAGTVDITSNNWDGLTEAPTRKGVPPALAFAVFWKNRWWAVDADDRTILRFTEVFEPQSYPTNYYIQIPFTRGDEIAGVAALGDVLVIFGKSKQAFLIIGQTSLDFEVRPSSAVEAGVFGFRALDVVEQGIVRAAAQGVYIFDGATDRLLSNDIDDDWRDMVGSSSEADLARVPLLYHRRDKEIRIGAPRIPMMGTAGEWVLQLSRTRIGDVPAWAYTDRTVGGYVQWDGSETTTGNQGRLFSWSDTIGRMYEEAIGTSANGSDLTADYEGPSFHVGLYVARFLRLYVEFEPNDGTFALDLRVDGRTVCQPSITIAGGVARYGSAVYGTSTYGGAQRTTIPIELPLEAEGYTFQVIGQYAGQAQFKWFRYSFEAQAEAEIRGYA